MFYGTHYIFELNRKTGIRANIRLIWATNLPTLALDSTQNIG